MKGPEPVLIDSNVLVYAHNVDASLHKKAVNLVREVLEGKVEGVLAQQNLIEFYSIITDRKRVAKPLSPVKANELVKKYFDSPLKIIFPNHTSLKETLILCNGKNIRNGEIFDIYLVATMLTNDIKTIVTSNTKDFRSFPKLKVLDLKDL